MMQMKKVFPDIVFLISIRYNRQLQLLIRLSRKGFEQDSDGLIAEMQQVAEALIPDGVTDHARLAHEFVKRLHEEAALYFLERQDFEVYGMETTLYAYQREGAEFLVTHDHAILADEAGLGKTIQAVAAAKTLGLRRILWVTTVSNKVQIEEEILTHSQISPNSVQIIESGDPIRRAKQIAALNGEEYVIINYKNLVALHRRDTASYALLTNGIDVVVVDEAQLADNPMRLRTRAIQDIDAPRKWLLTATPYQNKVDSIWTLLNWIAPERYSNLRAFRRLYTDNTQGLMLLHGELSEFMLRRRKQDVLSHFDPKVDFEEQLSDGTPRIPKLNRIEPDEYELSHEQSELIAWMVADFRGWAEDFNNHLPMSADAIDLDTINSLQKFGYIHKVIYDPEYFGLEMPEGFYQALDALVNAHIEQGEKVIVGCWNRRVMDQLETQFQERGVILERIDGTVVGENREQARHVFQENPDVRVLLINNRSGGVGLTLTAANSFIFAQIPPNFPAFYQTMQRHHRLIGLRNVRHAKDHVNVEVLLPVFPSGFVDGIHDPRLAEILNYGTLAEQTYARIEGGEHLFTMALEGYGDATKLDEYFKMGILRSMGLTADERLDYVAHLRGRAREYGAIIQHLMPLWNLVQGHADAETHVLELIDLYLHYPYEAARLGQAFTDANHAYTEDLAFIQTIFGIKNKYIREQMIRHIPDLIVRTYSQGQSLSQATQNLQIGRLILRRGQRICTSCMWLVSDLMKVHVQVTLRWWLNMRAKAHRSKVSG